MEITKYWKTIIDTLQDGLMVLDPQGNILALNHAAEKLTGYSAEELIGQNCRTLNCTGCDVFGHGKGQDWCRLFVDEEVRAKPCLISNRNNHAIHVIKNATVMKDEKGHIIGAVETFRDISENVRQQAEIETLRRSFHLEDSQHGLCGDSERMHHLFRLIQSVAQTDTPVLIQGPSGTGKELVARAIHEESLRKNGPFIKVNCAALNESLLESELFGHEKGAYTGADRIRIGRFEAAHEGTIFLDEIGDIPMSTQVKLLRVLEEKEIERVGDHKPIPVDVRIVSATNRDLQTLIAEGTFREDLFFRINVFPLNCPPLASRREDIPLIVQRFIELHSPKSGKRIEGLTPEALKALMEYHWPGNVRELRNAIEYAFVLCQDSLIDLRHLPLSVSGKEQKNTKMGRQIPKKWQTERDRLIEILRQTNGNQSEAARRLDVSRITVWKRMKKYQVDLDNLN